MGPTTMLDGFGHSACYPHRQFFPVELGMGKEHDRKEMPLGVITCRLSNTDKFDFVCF